MVDGERLLVRAGLTLFCDGLWVHGGQPGAIVGDAQGVSNLSAPPAVTLDEAWIQYNLFSNRLSVLGGRYDLNAEFYRLQSAGLFLNSSFGVGPEFSQSRLAGPSIFPYTSAGGRLALKPSPNTVVRVAVLDGVPVDRPDGSVGVFRPGDGLLFVSEAAVLSRPSDSPQPRTARFRVGRGSGLPPYDDKIAVGGWYYTSTVNHDQIAGALLPRHGSGGAYVLGDAVLWQSHDTARRRVGAFVEGGLGDGTANRFGSYAGGGLVAAAPLPARRADELGLAVAVANNGSGYLNFQRAEAARTDRSETAVEITYLFQVVNRLAVQPDLQYVIHPNTDPKVRNAVVLQLRFEARV